MLAASCVALGVCCVVLAALVLKMNRRLNAIENIFHAAAERLGEAEYV